MATYSNQHFFIEELDRVKAVNEATSKYVSLTLSADELRHSVVIAGTPAELLQLGETIATLGRQLADAPPGHEIMLPWPPSGDAASDMDPAGVTGGEC